MPENTNKPLADITVTEGNAVNVRANQGGSVRVLVMKNDNSGAVRYEDVPEGATVKDVAGGDGMRVRVNGQPADPDQPLRNNDKVVETPARVDGA